MRELAVARLTPLIDDQAAPLSIDDRSDAMLNLREALDALALVSQQRAKKAIDDKYQARAEERDNRLKTEKDQAVAAAERAARG